MSRANLFDREPALAISGLAGLTGPGYGEDVAAVVDVVVFGAKSDGKTQFITHAIRTFEAYAPGGLSAEEKLQNEKILSLVVNAKRPTPEANPDRKVRHYVFRVKPQKLYGGMSFGARLAALWRAGLLGGGLLLTLLFAAVVGASLYFLRGGADEAAILGVAGSIAGGLLLSFGAARRAFLSQGETELCFWDVAGEDVYSDRGAGGYHAFLEMLVRARRVHDEAAGTSRRYAIAPILICNPLSVGTRAEDSPYARLRMIMPTFASLGRPHPDVLVVVNRWKLVRAISSGAGEAEDCVAVLPVAREAEADTVPDAGGAVGKAPLPVVRRSVVLKHCRDGDPPEVGSTRFETVSYEAGLDPSVDEAEWKGWEHLPAEVRSRWGLPADTEKDVKALFTYRYAEGPGVLEGDTAASVYGWLGRLVWPDRASARAAAVAAGAGAGASHPVEKVSEPVPPQLSTGTVKMYAVDERGARSGAVENPGGFRSGGR